MREAPSIACIPRQQRQQQQHRAQPQEQVASWDDVLPGRPHDASLGAYRKFHEHKAARRAEDVCSPPFPLEWEWRGAKLASMCLVLLGLCPINTGLVVAPMETGGSLPASRLAGRCCALTLDRPKALNAADAHVTAARAAGFRGNVMALNREARDGDSSQTRCHRLELELRGKVDELQELRAKMADMQAELSELRGKLQGSGRELQGAAKNGDKVQAGVEAAWWDPAQVHRWIGSRPIGRIATSFPEKNGTPRQGSVAPASRAKLAVTFGNNPHHCLEGLHDFSHVWLVFLFHDNGPPSAPRAKVKPPRLGGATKGVFSTRAPHRYLDLSVSAGAIHKLASCADMCVIALTSPNPIGLSLCKLESVQGNVLTLSCVDLIDGTPILDIKPYIPSYDAPLDSDVVRFPKWSAPNAHQSIKVKLGSAAAADLQLLETSGECPALASSWSEAIEGLSQVLAADPRSVYRKQKCQGQVYPLAFDRLNAWCLFEEGDLSGPSVIIQRLFLAEAGVRLPKGGGAQSHSCPPLGDQPST